MAPNSGKNRGQTEHEGLSRGERESGVDCAPPDSVHRFSTLALKPRLTLNLRPTLKPRLTLNPRPTLNLRLTLKRLSTLNHARTALVVFFSENENKSFEFFS